MARASFSVLRTTSALFVLIVGALGSAPRPALATSNNYVTGTVTTSQSKPAPSMWVMVYDGAALKGRTLTGNDGRFYIGGLDEKTYTIVVKKQTTGGNLASQSVTLPQNSACNIRLP